MINNDKRRVQDFFIRGRSICLETYKEGGKNLVISKAETCYGICPYAHHLSFFNQGNMPLCWARFRSESFIKIVLEKLLPLLVYQ